MKGGEFERYVSKFFTKWLTGKETPYFFWRMPASGGLATIYSENIDMAGDIRALKKESQFLLDLFCIECKTGYPKTSFWQFFSKTNFKLKDFWSQVIDETPIERYPMLIYRKKGRKPCVGINNNIRLRLIDMIEELDFIMFSWKDIKYQMFLYDFEDFWSKIKPNHIKNILKELDKSL
jgi:hypothetical protein